MSIYSSILVTCDECKTENTRIHRNGTVSYSVISQKLAERLWATNPASDENICPSCAAKRDTQEHFYKLLNRFSLAAQDGLIAQSAVELWETLTNEIQTAIFKS